MLTRREMLLASTAGVLAGCAGGTVDAYEDAVAQSRAVLARDADMREFVRYATLAANSHNTQPWRFALSKQQVTIGPDFSRRTPVVDPDDHHLFASLGCAAENFILAAEARGKRCELSFDSSGDGRIVIALADGPAVESPLFSAIPQRQCTRSDYDGRAVPASDIAALEEAARMDGIRLLMIMDPQKREGVLDYVIEGNSAQMDNPAFVSELRQWLRFNKSQALETRDGLFSASSGNPTLPGWIADLIFGFVFTKGGENDRYARQIRSSSGIAVFISDRNDKQHWVDAGRSYQRFALQAAALGISQAPVNQAVEVAPVRAQFSSWLALGEERPDLIVRFGYGSPLPKSLRRPVEEVIA